MPRRRHQPRLQPGRPRIRRLEVPARRRRVGVDLRDRRRAHQAGDLRGHRGWRVAADFLPAFLLRRGPVRHHVFRFRPDVPLPRRAVGHAQLPGQDHRVRLLVHLLRRPVGPPVEPTVLREAAVRLLLHVEQVPQRPPRRGAVPGDHEAGGGFVEIPRPHQVVAAHVRLIGRHGGAPGDAHRGDDRSGERLVLVGADDHRREIELSLIRRGRSAQAVQVPAPAARVVRADQGEPAPQALPRRGERCRGGFPKPQRECEMRRPGDPRDLHDVPAVRPRVPPREPVMQQQVGVAVVDAGEPARGLRESAGRHQRGRHVLFLSHQSAAVYRAGVPIAGVFQRRMVEHVEGGASRTHERDVDQQRVPLRVRRIRLSEREAARGVARGLAIEQRAGIDARDGMSHVPRFDPHPPPVAHREFQPVHVGHVQARVIDLGENAPLQREPHLRCGGERGPDALLAGRRPPGHFTRAAGGSLRGQRHLPNERRAQGHCSKPSPRDHTAAFPGQDGRGR